jgi:RNA polymerase sigma-70 factor (ECF subfamily)
VRTARGTTGTGPPETGADDAGGTALAGFDDFARRERSALVAFGWSLTGSLATAEEIAQEALVAAWRSWDAVGDYDKPGAWARRVVANRASTHWRSAGRESRALERLAGSAPTPPDAVELPEPDAALWAAVRRLPDRQAQVIALYYLEDRSVTETAAILECAEGTVKAHLYKARLSLARALGLLAAAEAGAAAANDEEDER